MDVLVVDLVEFDFIQYGYTHSSQFGQKNSRNLKLKVTTILVVEWCYSFFILFTYIHCKFYSSAGKLAGYFMPKSLFFLIFLKEKALKIKAFIYIFYYNIIPIRLS